ncbi:outer membrane protein assembly factor BamD (plasmid) [Marinovum sp. KMM 9989]
MTRFRWWYVGVFAAAFLAACDGVPMLDRSTSATPSGPDDYVLARAAAEDQNYIVAIANYERVLAAYPRGKTGAEVRLELTKVLLFANQPVRAQRLAAEVPQITRNRELRGRAAILEVIADHLQLDTYLAAHPPYDAARDRARALYAKMEAVYDKHGKYDDDAIIPARIRVLRESLAELELRQMQGERQQGDTNTAAQRARYILTEFADTDAVQRNAQLLKSVTS